jgi:hypothetical protein
MIDERLDNVTHEKQSMISHGSWETYNLRQNELQAIVDSGRCHSDVIIKVDSPGLT